MAAVRVVLNSRGARAGRLFLGHFRRMRSASTATFRDRPSDQAGTPLKTLADVIHPFPAFNRVLGASLDELAAKVAR
jgi:hypothetical protein